MGKIKELLLEWQENEANEEELCLSLEDQLYLVARWANLIAIPEKDKTPEAK